MLAGALRHAGPCWTLTVYCERLAALTDAQFEALTDALEAWTLGGRFSGVFLSPDARTFSRAARGFYRTERRPLGVPGLGPAAQAAVDGANRLTAWVVRFVGLMAKARVRMVLETPKAALFNISRPFKRLRAEASITYTTVAECMFGADWQHTLAFYSTLAIGEGQTLDCIHKNHNHQFRSHFGSSISSFRPTRPRLLSLHLAAALWYSMPGTATTVTGSGGQ